MFLRRVVHSRYEDVESSPDIVTILLQGSRVRIFNYQIQA